MFGVRQLTSQVAGDQSSTLSGSTLPQITNFANLKISSCVSLVPLAQNIVPVPHHSCPLHQVSDVVNLGAVAEVLSPASR